MTGTLTKGGGSFKIDHPLDPENKYLSHSFVESPDMMNVYNGNVDARTRTATATVELPAYFEALNRDFRYQLTVIGDFAQAIVARRSPTSVSRSDRQAERQGLLAGDRHPPGRVCQGEPDPGERDKPKASGGPTSPRGSANPPRCRSRRSAWPRSPPP